MNALSPHSRLLTEAARRHLRPLGVLQKGRSRTWLDDRGWFVANIEFQPSGFSKGSYLNVGAHFLWQWGGYLTFDLGDRLEQFVPYESDAQFAPQADRLAARAASEVLVLRELLPDPSAVASVIPLPERGGGWPYYHRAVSLGLAAQPQAAAREFLAIAAADGDDRAWVIDLRERCRRFAELVAEPPGFRAAIVQLIAEQRIALKLTPVSDPLSG